MRHFRSKLGLITAVLLLGFVVVTAVAQNDPIVDLSTPDISQFPEVQLRVISIDSQGAPLPEEQLSRLTLRENGVPIPNFDLRFVPVGVDVTFVIDADTTIGFEDGVGGTRLDQVKESITRYANRFMSPAGLDRVSVIVPNQANDGGRFLVQDVSDPQELITAVSSYNPVLPEAAPVNEMLLMALEDGEVMREDGSYQSVLLFSDAFKLNTQLDYPTLTEMAQTAQAPIYVAVLGGLPTQEAIGNASALAAPTRGYYVTMPFAEESDPVYLVWQRQGNQPQVSYRSLLKQSGMYPISINIGTLAASTELDLTLQAPQVEVALPSSVLRRTGETPDTPLEDLQPTTMEIPVQITWSDGLPRELTAVTFRVNGQVFPLPSLPQPDANGVFTIPWNVQTVGTGAYDLDVQVVDALGFEAGSAVLIVTMAEERPLPPTATPSPTPTPLPRDRIVEISQRPRNDLLIFLAGLALLGIVLLVVRWLLQARRKTAVAQYRARRQAVLQEKTAQQPAVTEAEEAYPPMNLTLVPLDAEDKTPIPIKAEIVVIGQDDAVADLVLADKSVSRLHARIRQRNKRYWLYDEGSELGTFINHDRLGLSPKSLQNDDIIRIGRLRFQVQLTPIEEESE